MTPNFAPQNALLLGRIDQHAKHPLHAELRKAAETCLAIAQNSANRRDEVWQDRFLSAEGKRVSRRSSGNPIVAISIGAARPRLSWVGACPCRRTGIHFAGTCAKA